jgi:putative Mg2+ transporter-C (MgtC) family protein
MEKELIVLLHVMLAAFLAGIIGLERESYKKPAGLRTNMIVGGATALIISLGEIIVIYFNEQGLNEYVSADPIRIIQAIVVGVSFIGAGTVLQIQSEYKIKYLTTAATILFSTGIGIAVALHQYYLSVGVSIFILIINLGIGKIEDVLIKKKKN